MATIQASGIMFAAGLPSFYSPNARVSATMNAPKIRMMNPISLPKLSNKVFVEDNLDLKNGFKNETQNMEQHHDDDDHKLVAAKFFGIMEAVADRVEMHKSVGEQRNNWNHLFLSSINGITLTAAFMTGIAGTSSGSSLLALKLSSTILYAAATGMLALINRIQPSQLAEEQRNAERLFKLLHGELQTVLALGNPSDADVSEAMEKVLALDRAYPLPLLGNMLEKFPSRVEPAVWWPQQQIRRKRRLTARKMNNGWDSKLETQMRRIVEVIKEKDLDDYLRLANKALKLNKMLAVSGPLFSGIGAVASAFVDHHHGSSWAVIIGVVAGALASAANTFQHGGQLGMVFEMYRGNAGFFKLMVETIESNVNESDVERRENGDLFEIKVALCLGRSLSELRNLAATSSENGEANNIEFASKLF